MGSLGLTKIQKEEINQIIFDDYIKKIAIADTAVKIRRLYNLPDNRFNVQWIWNLRNKLKCSAKNELSKYQKDRYAYIQKYLDRIHAVEQLEREAWNFLKEKDKHSDEMILRSFSELREIEILLVDLYNNLSRVANIGQYDYETTDHTKIQYSEDNYKF